MLQIRSSGLHNLKSVQEYLEQDIVKGKKNQPIQYSPQLIFLMSYILSLLGVICLNAISVGGNCL